MQAEPSSSTKNIQKVPNEKTQQSLECTPKEIPLGVSYIVEKQPCQKNQHREV